MTRAKISFAAVLVLIAGASGAYYWYLHRPVQQTSYYGVSLSDGKSEVQYKLGVPTYVYGPPETGTEFNGAQRVYRVDGDPTTDKSALPRGQNFFSFDDWSYAAISSTGGRLEVWFEAKTKKVREIACYAHKVEPGSRNSVAGVDIGDTEDHVKSALGVPSSEKLDGVTKTLVYDRLNIQLYLEKMKVYMIEVGLHGAS
jgi:hypothetical protein